MTPNTIVTDTALLVFVTSRQEPKTLRINNARQGLDLPAVENAAELFKSANPFDATVGELTDLIGAEVVTQTAVDMLPQA